MPSGVSTNQLLLGPANAVLTVTGNNLYVNGVAAGGSVSVNPWTSLTWASTTLWTGASNVIEDKQILVLLGDTTLNITGLYNGWAGILKTVQSGNSTTGNSFNVIAFTSSSSIPVKVINNMSGITNLTYLSGAIDVLGFEYDGNHLLTTIGNHFS